MPSENLESRKSYLVTAAEITAIKNLVLPYRPPSDKQRADSYSMLEGAPGRMVSSEAALGDFLAEINKLQRLAPGRPFKSIVSNESVPNAMGRFEYVKVQRGLVRTMTQSASLAVMS